MLIASQSIVGCVPFPQQKSKQLISGRGIEFVLIKAEEGPYWPRLLREAKKCHWLKVDFNRWRDEDESDDEASGPGGGPGGDMDIEAVRLSSVTVTTLTRNQRLSFQ